MDDQPNKHQHDLHVHLTPSRIMGYVDFHKVRMALPCLMKSNVIAYRSNA